MPDKEGPTHNAGDMFEIYCYNMQKKKFFKPRRKEFLVSHAQFKLTLRS